MFKFKIEKRYTWSYSHRKFFGGKKLEIPRCKRGVWETLNTTSKRKKEIKVKENNKNTNWK